MQRTIDALAEVVRDMRVVNSNPPGGSNIQVNGGGVGVWIATVCCALMLGISLIGAMVILDQNRQLGEIREDAKETRSYIMAVYAIAPTLNPANQKDSEE